MQAARFEPNVVGRIESAPGKMKELRLANYSVDGQNNCNVHFSGLSNATLVKSARKKNGQLRLLTASGCFLTFLKVTTKA